MKDYKTEFKNNILHIKFDSQYQMTSMLIRIQEFYECPDYKNSYFELEEYMDYCAEKNGNFTYFQDILGCNIPGHIINKFYFNITSKLRDKELHLKSILEYYDLFKKDKEYYLIATCKEDECWDENFNHELSHAFYKLFGVYKESIKDVDEQIPESFKDKFKHGLKEYGYDEKVLDDELQAYMSTNNSKDLKLMTGISIKQLEKYKSLYVKNFKKHKVKYWPKT